MKEHIFYSSIAGMILLLIILLEAQITDNSTNIQILNATCGVAK